MRTKTLSFPADRIVGRLSWNGSARDKRGPVLATGPVEVPDDLDLALTVSAIKAVTRRDNTWSTTFSTEPVDLSFLSSLPRDIVHSFTLTPPFIHESFRFIVHLAPGLRNLYLSSTGLANATLRYIVALRELRTLQTSGNSFTDIGQLAGLHKLERLYLRESNIGYQDLQFVSLLDDLKWLVLENMEITRAQADALQAGLPSLSVVLR